MKPSFKRLYVCFLVLCICGVAVHAASSQEPIRIACVGDSITFGATIKDRANKCYPAQLQQLLGDGYVVKNFGVSGATLLKQGNKPYWKTKQFKPAHAFNPDIVVIKLGTNDSKPGNWQYRDAYVADYIALIEGFRALPSQPIVYICKPVPAYPGNFKITDKVIRGEVMPLVDVVAQQAQVEVIDLYAALSNRADLFPDKVHPNAKGARIMAETIYPFVAGRLPVSAGVFLDLDANHAVELEDGNRVKAWHNQVRDNAADVFVKQDEGRKRAGSGRPTLKTQVAEIGGHNTLVFEEQELINMDEDAFDHMVSGCGYTWFSVMSVYKQHVGKKDVNSFFGNLRNGPPYEGFWGNLFDDNRVWMGTRNGFQAEGKKGKKKPTLWDETLNPCVATKEPLAGNQYYLVMGRMGAGQEVVDLELFINSAQAVDSQPVPVNPNANPSKMAVGQERDAINHPGKESFHGEIARFLVYERPLSDAELSQMIQYLIELYQVEVRADHI